MSLQVFECRFVPHLSGKRRFKVQGESTHNSEKKGLELPLFDLVTIAEATNNFSENNKLGEGGFGPVYMVIFLIYLCSDETYIKSILVTQNDHYVVGKDTKIVILIH